ncbi:hypothetical protein L3X38_011076 [Prunus dulcis]|uniref:Uncharacterized protein n=1 Tax=Prunus dulcis TaxID=3755 RepID=A0AAD4WGV5_PRUDU|nr:hypothetical protein L3X38_011076 [Prunus dulcis]
MTENESLENQMKTGEFSPVSGELSGRQQLRLVGTGPGKDDGTNGSSPVAGGSRWRWLWRREAPIQVHSVSTDSFRRALRNDASGIVKFFLGQQVNFSFTRTF